MENLKRHEMAASTITFHLICRHARAAISTICRVGVFGSILFAPTTANKRKNFQSHISEGESWVHSAAINIKRPSLNLKFRTRARVPSVIVMVSISVDVVWRQFSDFMNSEIFHQKLSPNGIRHHSESSLNFDAFSSEF